MTDRPTGGRPQAGVPRRARHLALSSLIALTWLLLQPAPGIPDLLVALLLAWILPRRLAPLLGASAAPLAVGGRRWSVALTLLGVVLRDIVTSNIAVARLVLAPTAKPTPRWVPVPLEVQHPNAIALLASIITMTPGTVSCVVDEEGGLIWVHALDTGDAAGTAADIKLRYEARLKEILG